MSDKEIMITLTAVNSWLDQFPVTAYMRCKAKTACMDDINNIITNLRKREAAQPTGKKE